MLVEVSEAPQYGSHASIIPGGTLQFFDFDLNIDKLAKVTRSFQERNTGGTGPGAAREFKLVCLDQDAETQRYFDRRNYFLGSGERGERESYILKAEVAINAFSGQWIPVPVFKLIGPGPHGTQQFSRGPSNWARMYIHKLDERDKKGNSHRVVLAFDTQVEQRPDINAPQDGDLITSALSDLDVQEGGEFQLVSDERQCDWFLSSAWISAWIEGCYRQHIERVKNRPVRDEDFEYRFEAIARYITLLHGLDQAEIMPRFRLIDPTQFVPVEVDLVLDLGNTRTCGMMIETQADEQTRLNDSYVLELRDLSKPHLRYGGAFSSRIEFALARFGSEALSKDSGRVLPAFAWPSVVRVGPEAARLSAAAKQGEGLTGMSSPKRYLWDEFPRQQQWRFNSVSADDQNAEAPVVRGSFVQFVNNEGTPIDLLDDWTRETRNRKDSAPYELQLPDPVMDPRFSRASLMMFMLGELVTQALVTMNAPATRYNRPSSDIPRRLRSVILTMPTAMPIIERNILRRMAEAAVQTIWRSLGWSEFLDLQSDDKSWAREARRPPKVRCEWDEASATQLVYLYNEIFEEFKGDIDLHFQTFGRRRAISGPDGQAAGEASSLRVASVDIGGGTTDLIVTTYVSEGTGATAVLRPIQNFREGFNIAGDDVVRAVIENHVMTAVRDNIATLGHADPAGVLNTFFGDKIQKSTRVKVLRAQLTQRVLVPIALAMLGEYEACDPRRGNVMWEKSFSSFFVHEVLPPGLVKFFDQEIERLGVRGFDIQAVSFAFTSNDIDLTVQNEIGRVIEDLSEVLRQYDCDVLLLTGRTSCYPAIQAGFLARLPVPPHAVIPLNRYRVDRWYPFRGADGRIPDPKTTVVVGAMLCALAEGYTEAFRFQSHLLKAESTARYIGDIDTGGRIRAPLFSRIDLDDPKEAELEASFDFHGLVYIGYRQLQITRWPATPLFRLEYENAQAAEDGRGRTPYKAKLVFRRAEQAEESPRRGARGSYREEGVFKIEEVEARDGTPVRRQDLALRLQTLKDREGYWLDTGNLNVS
ncbi:MAG: ssrAB activated protein [Alphaproteobacteria bacterium]|nr:ssrAB activated protein [Alphaproteobacteria bacterium]MBM3645999.1 ssrAB activated protein [Alphaproteobacteria bacterium]